MFIDKPFYRYIYRLYAYDVFLLQRLGGSPELGRFIQEVSKLKSREF